MPLHGAARQTILFIVAADLAVRESLRFALELEGFAARIFEGGLELLEHQDLPEASCLIIEDKLPGIGAFEILAKLAERQLRNPVIHMTSHATASLQRQAANAGIGQIVEKPLMNGTLMECVRNILSRP